MTIIAAGEGVSLQIHCPHEATGVVVLGRNPEPGSITSKSSDLRSDEIIQFFTASPPDLFEQFGRLEKQWLYA
jgi:hypothetical protein